MTSTMRLTCLEIRALCEFASRDTARDHLTIVHFEPAAGIAAATDGHTLAVLHAHPSEGAPFDVYASDLRTAARHCTKAHREVTITAETLSVGIYTAPVTPRTVKEGKHALPFPPFRQVIPDVYPVPRACVSFGIHASYLARLALVTAACADEERPKVVKGRRIDPQSPLTVYPGKDELDPVVFVAESIARSSRWTVVIMPMRVR